MEKRLVSRSCITLSFSRVLMGGGGTKELLLILKKSFKCSWFKHKTASCDTSRDS